MSFKIFGVHRTGTNYLQALLDANIIFPPETEILQDKGWKHEAIPRMYSKLNIETKNTAIVIIKNPYMWYPSAKYWIEAPHKDSLEPIWGDGSIEFIYKNYYNRVYAEHKEFLEGNFENTVYTSGILVCYEDLIRDAKSEVCRVANLLGVAVHPDFKDFSIVPCSVEFSEERRQYYLNQIPNLDNEVRDKITDVVDWELMKFYGYSKIVS